MAESGEEKILFVESTNGIAASGFPPSKLLSLPLCPDPLLFPHANLKE